MQQALMKETCVGLKVNPGTLNRLAVSFKNCLLGEMKFIVCEYLFSSPAPCCA